MRCQYCGKRLPLFRKLKDGEFCSAAHREQFHAQSDQLAVAALREQRERTMRAARPEPAVVPGEVAPAVVASAPMSRTAASATAVIDSSSGAQEASFCDRYVVSSLAAIPLGQLARVPLEPMMVRQQYLMPERTDRGRTLRLTGNWVAGEAPVRGLPADQMLLALSVYGASGQSPTVAPTVAPTGAAPQFSPSVEYVRPMFQVAPQLMLCTLLELEVTADDVSEAVEVPSAEWARWPAMPGCIPRLQVELATDSVVVAEDEVEYLAAPMCPAALLARMVPCVPAAELAMGAGTMVRVPGRLWQPVSTLWRSFAGLALADLECEEFESRAVLPVSVQAPLALVGARVRFPALVPVFSTMPVRRRAVLALADCTGRGLPSMTVRQGEPGAVAMIGVAAIAVLTPQVLLAGAHAAFADRLRITGELRDLLPPVMKAPVIQAIALTPPCRIPWRFEAQNVTAIRTLAIRHLAMDVTMRLPARPTVRVGPRRAEQQLRLNAVLRPARFEFAAGADAVNFHLEPKVVQPRLRVRPDPARQGGAARSKGTNHADAAISSIKIPVLRRFWAHAPADIRWVALIIPLVFFLAWYSWTPNGKALNKQAERADLAVDTSGVQTVFASFKSRISSRAAVELSEDFRTGLAEWQGARQDWAANWSYDQAGFVRPGNLALFTPTVGLNDYNFEFLGQIENRALSWVYRAKDARNYYLGRLVITRGGPVPEVSLVRSVVKNGRESKQRLTVLTMNLRLDTIYRVRVDVNGSDFTTSVLGQVVDTFTDGSHPQGGIGFYGGHGETSRVRWVEVSHQYDTLGRLCAMLVPYGLAGASAPVKTDGPATF